MTSRRDFVRYCGAVMATLSAPSIRPASAAEVAQLPTRPIPRTNEPLPIVGLGNARAFQEGDVALSRQLLEILMDHGGAYVDTSGESRLTIGGIVREKGADDRTFIGTYTEEVDERAARQDLQAILQVQGGGALDLVLTRNIDEYSSRRDAFRRFKDEGLTRYIGVARHQQQYHERMMQLMEDGAVDFVQVNYSILEPEAEDRLLPMAQDKGIAILINRPFINGRWFSIVRDRTLPDWAAEFDCATWAQFSLKFILAHPAVNCVLTETSNPRHAVDNIGGGIGRLPDEETRRRMRELVKTFV